MRKPTNKEWTGLALLAAAIILLIIVIAWPTSDPVLSQIRDDGQIRIITRNAPTTYYEGRDGPEGYEFELTQAFAEHLGVEVEYRLVDNVDEILRLTAAGEVHLAAAGLTRTDTRRERGLFGPGYMTVAEQVVCRRGGQHPDSVEDLADVELKVTGGTSYINTLKQLQAGNPALTWETADDLSTEQIMQQVWKREVDCTIADSNIVAINRRYYPELTVEFDLSPKRELAWFLPPEAYALQDELESWFAQISKSGYLDELEQHYYGHVEIFDFVDTRAFKRRINNRLPAYKPLFKQAEQRHGIPWDLLAAQAYQESHWNPQARSPTGVRGIMMLTRNTAGSLDVTNRLDPAQSIDGGARYLKRMMGRVPDSVVEEDRLWFALAAYNVGMGHIHDARTLAKRQHRDPDRWIEVAEMLPLLTQEKYYKTVKYGYARGTEPVLYVQRIRNYRDILRQTLPR
jgi:membrane-bound lytic murein transglycosylase F